MFKNYIIVAFRNLLKHKFYSFLNILGLTIGLGCFILITLFVKDELSYDTHFKDAERMYRVDFFASLNGSDVVSAETGAPMAAALRMDFPEVEDAVRISNSGNWFVRKVDDINTFKEDHVMMADSNFFSFFQTPLIFGNKNAALDRPNTIALNYTTSKKIFGEANPVGQTLILDNNHKYEVTAVYEDFPSNSHFGHNILLSMSSFERASSNNWLSTNFNTYVKLREGVTQQDLEFKFPEMIETYCAPLIEQFLGLTLKEFKESGNGLAFSLFPIEDIHLHSNKEDELEANGDIKYVYLFSAIGLFILVLACINFMNLTTARSANRAKEVGVRKVMGAFKSQLIKQFMSESMLISFISLLLSFALVILTLPGLSQITQKSFSLSSLLNGPFLFIMLGITLLVGLLAGSYPAFYLSIFKPAEVLKGKIRQGMKSGVIRSTLVVFQFSISIIMIIGTAIVFDQLSFIQNKKLGYEKDQLLMVNDAWILEEKVRNFKDEASQNTNIISSTLTSFTPLRSFGNSDLYFKNQSAASDESLVINHARIDHDFIETMGIGIAEGRDFSKDLVSDSSAVIVNRAAVEQFGYENPIGSMIYNYGGSDENPEVIGYRIIGVIEDFHYESLKNNISPLLFRLGERSGIAMFKVQMKNVDATIDFLESKWDQFAPGQPFEYRFVNDEFNKMYEQEQQTGKVLTIFAGIAIIIACLGLFGLAAFTAEQRNKEIGIRKTLGASISSIIKLLSMNFIKLVIASFIIASPIAYFMMNYWLDDFAYRTAIKPATFIISGVLAALIAALTISYQSWNAARVNPVKSLRSE